MRFTDFLNGLVAGWTQVFIMQPFEKIKVMLQTQGPEKKYNGILDCIKNVVKHEGFMGFYKGTLVPLIGIGIIGSVRFGVFENLKIRIREAKGISGTLPLQYSALAAFLTGTVSSFLVCPIEHMRIRIQIQKSASERIYSGSLNALIVIFQKYGVAGVYKGMVPSVTRECTGLTFFFTVIDYLTKKLTPHGVSKKDTPFYVPFIAGGLGGTAYWAFNYPIDYVKTLMQSDSFEKPKYSGFTDCIKKQYAASGLRGFFKGYTICMMRSFPVNAGALVSYRLMQKILHVDH